MISIRRLVSAQVALARRRKSGSEAFLYRDEVYRYVFARVNHAEEAEDLTMEVIHSVKASDSPDNLKAYMIGIARNKISDHYRLKKDLQPLDLAESKSSFLNSDEFLRIQLVLGRLAEIYQECLVLKYVCGFSSEEIATMLSTTPGAVDNTLQRSRKAFTNEWNQLNGDENE